MPDVPFNLATLTIVAPYAFILAMVGLIESLLTAQLVDDVTDTRSDKDRESRRQGVANVTTGFLGGMAGCA
jgi:SulP family sulfate permease